MFFPFAIVATSLFSLAADGEDDVPDLDEVFRRSYVLQNPNLLVDAMFEFAKKTGHEPRDLARDMMMAIGRFVAEAGDLESMGERMQFLMNWFHLFVPSQFNMTYPVDRSTAYKAVDITWPYQIFDFCKTYRQGDDPGETNQVWIGPAALHARTFGGPPVRMLPDHPRSIIGHVQAINFIKEGGQVLERTMGYPLSWDEANILTLHPSSKTFRITPRAEAVINGLEGMKIYLQRMVFIKDVRAIFEQVGLGAPKPQIVRQCARCGARGDQPHKVFTVRGSSEACRGRKVPIPVYSKKDANWSWRPENIKVSEFTNGLADKYTIYRTTPITILHGETWYIYGSSSENPYSPQGIGSTAETRDQLWLRATDAVKQGEMKWVKWDSLPVQVRQFAWELAVDD